MLWSPHVYNVLAHLQLWFSKQVQIWNLRQPFRPKENLKDGPQHTTDTLQSRLSKGPSNLNSALISTSTLQTKVRTTAKLHYSKPTVLLRFTASVWYILLWCLLGKSSYDIHRRWISRWVREDLHVRLDNTEWESQIQHWIVNVSCLVSHPKWPTAKGLISTCTIHVALCVMQPNRES